MSDPNDTNNEWSDPDWTAAEVERGLSQADRSEGGRSQGGTLRSEGPESRRASGEKGRNQGSGRGSTVRRDLGVHSPQNSNRRDDYSDAATGPDSDARVSSSLESSAASAQYFAGDRDSAEDRGQRGQRAEQRQRSPERRAEPFRFIHAGDFYLHQPLSGLSDLPASMKEALASAPYLAAERIFDAAISERVAFVLLSGNLVDLDFGGPRAIAFLLSQFERLAQRNIRVFWCGGKVDPLDRWPSVVELPSNVRLFPSTLVDAVAVQEGNRVLATIFGAAYDPHRSSFKDFRTEQVDGFAIALTCGGDDPTKQGGHGIRYWAMGGKAKREVSVQGSVGFGFPGTPQARDAKALGPHGAILVSVEANGQLRTQAIDCEVARWMNISLTVAETVKTDALKDLLADRALQVSSKLPDANLLVHWHIATTGEYSADFRKQENRSSLLKWLRHEFGSSPGLWSVDLTFSSAQNIPKVWYEEDTILGEFLREVSRFRNDDQLPLLLHNYVGAQDEIEGVGRLTKVESERRSALLDAVVLEGIERLGGNES